jgi:hypothetical protein
MWLFTFQGFCESNSYMPRALPRVTYSNIAGDFSALRDWLDTALPRCRKALLGQAWPNVVGRAAMT